MAWLRRDEHEARRDRRCTAPVLARVKGERDGYRRVEDIGVGGFRLATDLALNNGDRIPVRLRFPDLWEDLELEARVAWADRAGYAGFDFSGIDIDDAGFLSVLIAHQEVLGRV